jgi:hypothetical protein
MSTGRVDEKADAVAKTSVDDDKTVAVAKTSAETPGFFQSIKSLLPYQLTLFIAVCVKMGQWEWLVNGWAVGFCFLYAARIHLYCFGKKKQPWFLFDTCYVVNLWLLLAIFRGFPFSRLDALGELLGGDACTWFFAEFVAATGFTAWGVPLWRNKLVLSNVDLFTSCYLHIMPVVVVYARRWHLAPTSTVCAAALADTSDDSTHVLVAFTLKALAALCAWNVVLFTAYRLVAATTPCTLTQFGKQLAPALGQPYEFLSRPQERGNTVRYFVYMFILVIGTFVFMLFVSAPAMAMFHRQSLHALFIVVLVACAALNARADSKRRRKHAAVKTAAEATPSSEAKKKSD